MRIVFMGTPDFAANILMELKEQHDVIAVYTRPDAVRGRGKALLASPVKKVALEAGIDVFEPKTLRSEEEVARLRNLAPDAICAVSYTHLVLSFWRIFDILLEFENRLELCPIDLFLF